MKKVKLGGIAIMVSVMLLGASVNMAKAEEAVDTYVADAEGEAGTVSNTDTPLTSLSLGDTDQSGDGWKYVGSTHTLNITSDVMVEGSAEKIIGSDGDLTITVAEGATLTVENSQTSGKPYGIYAGGKLTLDGKGTVKVEAGKASHGVFSNQGITIKNITLNIDNPDGERSIAAGDTLEIESAVVTVKGVCAALKTSTRYPVKILGNSIVNIDGSETNARGLQGSEFEFSDNAHVKISSKNASIGDRDANLKLITEPAKGYYWKLGGTSPLVKTDWRDTFEKENACANSTSFEYIGSKHFNGDFKQNIDQKTHSKTCSCDLATTITMDCSGGEATCTQRAVCSVCHEEYGEQARNHVFNKYHICTKCGEAEPGVVVTVTAGSEMCGYMEDDVQKAITYAIDHPGSDFKLLSVLTADSITINDSKANFTVDLNGQAISNGWTVTNGTVTITDASENASGGIYGVTVNDNATVSLKSGTVFHIVDVKGGVFNVDGGTIATIYFNGGQVNWNSATATVTGDISYNDKSNNIMVMNAKPGKPLNIVLDARRDLEKPFATVKNGSIPDEYISTIRLVTDGTFYKYSLKPAIENNQLFARFPLNQNEVDITLNTGSDLVYNGSVREPVVTVQRYMLVLSGDKYMWDSKFTPLKEGKDFTVSYTDNTNAGTAKVTITGIGCYTGSVERTFTIAKAAPEKSSIEVDMSDRTYSCRIANTDQVDLSAYLPKDGGTVTATAISDGNVSYSYPPKVTDGKLSYTIARSDSPQSGTIKVTVSTTNYEDFTITVPITTKDLGIVCLKDGSSVALVNDTLTEGEKLSKLTFKDAVFVDEADKDKEVSGTLSWQTPDAVPALGTTSAQWVFQPKDADKYAPLSGSVAITVQKKSDAGSGDASSGGGSIGGGGGGGAATADTKSDESKLDDPKKNDTNIDNSKQDNKTDDTKNDNPKQDVKKPASKGTKLKTASGVTYRVTSSSSKKPTVAFVVVSKKAKGTVTIPKSVTIDGVEYKVTSIAARAFAGNKKVKHIVVPSTVTSIGKNAFADCAKLRTITINTTKLNSKNVADGAFDNIEDGTVIQVPKSMLAKYKKLFEQKGLSKKVKIVAIKGKKK